MSDDTRRRCVIAFYSSQNTWMRKCKTLEETSIILLNVERKKKKTSRSAKKTEKGASFKFTYHNINA